MPKRKQAADKEEEQPVYTLYEFIDAEALKEVYEMNLPNDVEHKVVQLHNEVQNSQSQRIKVEYFKSEKNPEGRLYARGPSTQLLPGWIRRCITWRNQIDLDFVNCGPTLRLHLFEQNGMKNDVPTLQYMVKNREDFYKKIHKDRSVAKDLTIKAMNGCGNSKLKSDLLITFKNEMNKACEKFCQMDEHHFNFIAYRDQKPEKHNAQKFVGLEVTKLERKCLDCMVKYLQQLGQTVSTLSFDGCTIELTNPCEGGMRDYVNYEHVEYNYLCPILEGHIKQDIDVALCIKVKSLFLSMEEIQKVQRTPKILKKIKPVTRVLPYILSLQGMRQNLCRRNGFVMQKHPRVPCAWEQLMEAKEYISIVLIEHPDYQTANIEKLLEWFDDNDNIQFPILRDNKRYVAFRNKRFDLQTMQCEEWECIQEQIDCTHYFDSDFEEKETPLWDSLLKFQLTPGYVRMVEILIGKLFYDVNLYEKWNVFLFILGYGNTGKSTIMRIIESAFPVGSCGILSGATEETFGMQTLLNKRCTIVYDISKGFHKAVNQQQYQGMISGDTLTVPIKNKQTVTLQWKTPMVMAGNFLPQYVDVSGSVARRIFAAKFHSHIPGNVMNTNMQDDIIRDELVSVFIRCVKKYRATCEEFKGKDFWTYVAGPEFEDMKQETARATNHLACYLDEGNAETKVLYKEGSFVSLEQVQKLYDRHLELLKLKPEKISDYAKFTEREYAVQRCQVCRKCGQPATQKYCKCSGKKIRSVKVLIQHMIIQTFNGCNWETKQDNIMFVPSTGSGMEVVRKRNDTIAEMVKDAQEEEQAELDEKLGVTNMKI